MTSEKKYGLFLPKNSKKTDNVKIANVFGDDDDDDETRGQDSGSKGISSKYGATANKKSVIKRQTQIDIDKALAEDPTVFEYDSVYDNMAGHKEEKKTKKVVEQKPRYIEQLLKASDKRKKEDERRQERKIQKEREAEGEEFADKEVFVTSAYKKKMEERQAEEEKERREAEMEAMLDVTKQKDLTGFYRFILNETTKEVKKEPESDQEESGDKEVTGSAVKPKVKRSDSDDSPPRHSSKDGRKRRRSSSPERSRSPVMRKQKESRKQGPVSDSDSEVSDDQQLQSKNDVSRSHDHSSRSHDHSSRSDKRLHDKKDRKDKVKKSRYSTESDDEVEKRPSAKKGVSLVEANGGKPEERDHKGRKTDGENIDLDADEDDPVDSDSSEDVSKTEEDFVGPARPVEMVDTEKSETKKEPVKSRYARCNAEEDIKAARTRYLTRKLAKERLRGVD